MKKLLLVTAFSLLVSCSFLTVITEQAAYEPQPDPHAPVAIEMHPDPHAPLAYERHPDPTSAQIVAVEMQPDPRVLLV